MDEKPAYVPFFKEVLEALSYLDAEDVKAYTDAILAYVYRGEQPTCSGPAMSIFVMCRHQLDCTMSKAADNRRNAGRRRKKSKTVATAEQPVSETEATAEQPVSETGASTEQLGSETEATAEHLPSETGASGSIHQASSFKHQEDKPLKPYADEDVGDHGERAPYQPTFDEWAERWEQVASDRGIPFDDDELEAAEGAFNHYEHTNPPWTKNDGEPVRYWRKSLSICFNNRHPVSRGPTIDEVIAYIDECSAATGVPVSVDDAKRFHGHYDGVGWNAGYNRVVNWKSKFQEWMLNNRNRQRPVRGGQDNVSFDFAKRFDANAELVESIP